MGVNRDTHAPSVTGQALAYDAVLSPTLRGIDVKAAGSLVVEDVEGNTWKHTFVALNPTTAAAQAYTTFPYRLELQIRKIVGDGAGSVGTGPNETDIALADLIGLH